MKMIINKYWLLGPILGMLLGGGIGNCISMIYCQDPTERARVPISDSLPIVIRSLLIGFTLGIPFLIFLELYPKLCNVVEFSMPPTLLAVVLAPLGWILGDFTQERSPYHGMVTASVVGVILGLIISIYRAYKRNHL